MRFPTFARCLNINGTTKEHKGKVDATLNVGGVTINSGDIIVADADAVLVLPAASIYEAVSAGELRVAKERCMMERLRAGETTLEILGLNGEDKT